MSLQQITANDILSLPANTVSNTQLVAGSVENYLSSQNSFITYRNRIHNGEMAVNQRATSNTTNTAVNLGTAAYNGVDRWKALVFNSSGSFNPTVSWKQTADHPIKGSSGYCLEVVTQTPSTPIGTSDIFGVLQQIEAQNITDLFCGSNSQNLTLSFWVKTNVTGTYSIELRDQGTSPGPNGQYILSTSYAVPTSGVWQKVVLNIPAPTYSAMSNSVNSGLGISFYYASTLTLANNPGINAYNTWVSDSTWGYAANTQANLFSSAGNYFRLTDVQFEAGNYPTPFERRPYAVELPLCQRYLQSFGGQSFIGNPSGTNGNNMNPAWNFPIPMRAAPSVVGNVSGSLQSYTTNYATTSWSFSTSSNSVQYLVTSNPSNPGYSSFLIAQMTTCLLSAEI